MRAKSFFFVAAIFCALVGLTLTSCAPKVDEPGQPNALVASADTVSLASATAKSDITLRLRCGCAFTVDSLIAVSGDIDKIVMTVTDTRDTITQHVVQFSAKP